MTLTVELTRFRTSPQNTERLMASRPAMVAEFTQDRVGFLGATIVQLPDNEWLDILWWRSPEALAHSRQRGANLPGIAAFFDLIGEVLVAEEGTASEVSVPQSLQCRG